MIVEEALFHFTRHVAAPAQVTMPDGHDLRQE
jgi:hypothetical protein